MGAKTIGASGLADYRVHSQGSLGFEELKFSPEWDTPISPDREPKVAKIHSVPAQPQRVVEQQANMLGANQPSDLPVPGNEQNFDPRTASPRHNTRQGADTQSGQSPKSTTKHQQRSPLPHADTPLPHDAFLAKQDRQRHTTLNGQFLNSANDAPTATAKNGANPVNERTLKKSTSESMSDDGGWGHTSPIGMPNSPQAQAAVEKTIKALGPVAIKNAQLDGQRAVGDALDRSLSAGKESTITNLKAYNRAIGKGVDQLNNTLEKRAKAVNREKKFWRLIPIAMKYQAVNASVAFVTGAAALALGATVLSGGTFAVIAAGIGVSALAIALIYAVGVAAWSWRKTSLEDDGLGGQEKRTRESLAPQLKDHEFCCYWKHSVEKVSADIKAREQKRFYCPSPDKKSAAENHKLLQKMVYQALLARREAYKNGEQVHDIKTYLKGAYANEAERVASKHAVLFEGSDQVAYEHLKSKPVMENGRVKLDENSHKMMEYTGEVETRNIEFSDRPEDVSGMRDADAVVDSLERKMWVAWMLRQAEQPSNGAAAICIRRGDETTEVNKLDDALTQKVGTGSKVKRVSRPLDEQVTEINFMIRRELVCRSENDDVYKRLKHLKLTNYIHGMELVDKKGGKKGSDLMTLTIRNDEQSQYLYMGLSKNSVNHAFLNKSLDKEYQRLGLSNADRPESEDLADSERKETASTDPVPEGDLNPYLMDAALDL